MAASAIISSAPLAPRRGLASPIPSANSSRSISRVALQSKGNLASAFGAAFRGTSLCRRVGVVEAAAASAPPRAIAAAAAAASASTSSPSPSPSPSAAPSTAAPAVVLTREAGKNGKLAAALAQRGLSTLELPLVQTAEGPDAGKLPGFISAAAAAEAEGGAAAASGGNDTKSTYEWIIVTSPESASVFVGGWKAAGSPKKGIRVAAVGTGTARALSAAGFSPRVEFTPSVANAVTLAAELPFVRNGCRRVLYPASAKVRLIFLFCFSFFFSSIFSNKKLTFFSSFLPPKQKKTKTKKQAGSDLQEGLAARGFEVDRLNTYTTLPVPRGDLPADAVAAARRASVVALASPSAAKAWLEVIAGGGSDVNDPSSTSSSSSDSVCGGVAAACIGSTTADAARKAGFERVFAPEEPGLAGFVEAVVEALEEMKKKNTARD